MARKASTAPKEPIRFEPDGQILSAFLMSDADFDLIQGPIGSGKTDCAIMRLFRHASQQPRQRDGKRRSRFAIVRQTFPELKTTTIPSFTGLFPEGSEAEGGFGEMSWSPPFTYYMRHGDIEADFIFLALDKDEDVKKLRSLQLTGIYFNETQYISLLMVTEGLSRCGRYPKVKDGGCTWSGGIADMNAPESLHWAPIMFGKAVHPLFRSENERNSHVASGPIPFRTELDLYCGLDFGLTPAAVFCQTVRGRVFVIAELYAEDVGAVTFAPFVKAEIIRRFPGLDPSRVKFFGDPGGDIRGQAEEKTAFDIFRQNGMPVMRAPGANRFLGKGGRKEVIDNLLQRQVDGYQAFLVGNDCRMIVQGLGGGYQFKVTNTSAGKFTSSDIVKNAYSHPCEALGYACLGMGEGAELLFGGVQDRKPVETKVAALTYRRAATFSAWGLWSTTGAWRSLVAVSGDLFAVSEREIDGETAYRLERFSPTCWADGMISLHSLDTAVPEYAGHTVGVWDGASKLGEFAVDDDGLLVGVDDSFSAVQVGLDFPVTVETMPPVDGERGLRPNYKITRVDVDCIGSVGFKGNGRDPSGWSGATIGGAVEPQTGVRRFRPLGRSKYPTFTITQDVGGPLEIRTITMEVTS